MIKILTGIGLIILGWLEVLGGSFHDRSRTLPHYDHTRSSSQSVGLDQRPKEMILLHALLVESVDILNLKFKALCVRVRVPRGAPINFVR